MTADTDRCTDGRISTSVRDVMGLAGFDAAASAVVEHLSSAVGLALWMVTRTSGDDWVVLRATESPYDVRRGHVLHWPDSLCARMVRGEGPRIALDVAQVPVYRSAPITRQHPIGSYVGVPLTGPDGELFGTLCGIDPERSEDTLLEVQPLLELQGRLLSGLLAEELRAVRSERAAHAARQRLGDQVLGTARWRATLHVEQSRSAPHAAPASVIALAVDAASERSCDVEVRVQRLLLDRRRPFDAVARTGPGSYAVLCPETLEPVAQTIATDLVLRLQDVGVLASCGVAATDPRGRELPATWEQAELARRADRAAVCTPGDADLACA